MQHYFSDEELNMSFPIWFNDSIIQANKIKSITRSVYLSSKEMEQELGSPSQIKHYHFDKFGEILSVDIDQFYENTNISSLSFNYLSPKDDYGFAPVEKVINSSSHKDDNEELYRIYDKVKQTEKYLVYKDEDDGDYLFYMTKKESWGSLSVDSILNPTPNDIIVLGTPYFPSKLYQVKNTVNEFNSSRYKYDKSDEFVRSITFDAYPFVYKRNIQYDKGGKVTGFIDSTFSENKYITRRVSKFKFNDNLPKSLTHIKKLLGSEDSYYHIENIEYTFYE